MEKTKFYAVSMVTVFLFCLFNVIYAGNFSGELGEVKGKVEILKDGEKDWIPAVEEMPLQLKDRVKTYAESTCNLELDDGSIINVGDNTDILVENLEISSDKHESKFSLFFGKIMENYLHNDRLAAVPQGGQQAEILHVTGSHLEGIGIFLDHPDIRHLDDFGYRRQVAGTGNIPQDMKAFDAESLKTVRAGPWLKGAAP